MAERLSRRDGLKLLAAMAGGATAVATSGSEPGDLLPVGGDGPDPAPASLNTYEIYRAETFAEVEYPGRDALVVVAGDTDQGLVEVTQ